MHALLRQQLKAATQKADQMQILYGGSVKPDNAAQLFAQPDIDGGLIGGASLEARSFLELVTAAAAARGSTIRDCGRSKGLLCDRDFSCGL